MEENDTSRGKFYFFWGIIQSYTIPIIFQGIYLICYKLELPLIERYKCLEEPWPWYGDKKSWDRLYWRTVYLYCLNVLIISPFFYVPFYVWEVPVDLDFSMDGIPSSLKMVGQVLFCMLMEDLTFHISHRMLHRPSIYPYIHKIHHEHKVTIGMAAYHAHPLEFIFGNVLPSIVGPLILKTNMHFLTAFTWYFLRTAESIDGHSGYEFSWSPFRILPFASDYGYHTYHHSNNVGNYSSFFTIWDTVLGSNSAYYQDLKERREAEKKTA